MTLDEKRESSKLLIEAIKEGGVLEGYKRVDIDFFQFKNIGDKVSGTLINKDKINIGAKINRIGKYIIKSGEQRVSFLGSVQLDEKMSTVPTGAEIVVIYTDNKEIGEGMNPMKCYEVFVKETKH